MSLEITTATSDRLLLAETIAALRTLLWAAHTITQPGSGGITECDVAILRNEIKNAELVLALMGVKS